MNDIQFKPIDEIPNGWKQIATRCYQQLLDGNKPLEAEFKTEKEANSAAASLRNTMKKLELPVFVYLRKNKVYISLSVEE